MRPPTRRRSPFPLLLLLPLTAGCATGGPSGTAGPAPAAATPPPAEAAARTPTASAASGSERLRPTPEVLRSADRATLTGLETGTMWTFENPPLSYWDSVYGFRPDEAWLEHVRLSSVRYGEICSASFVSPDGLVMTNHHCARDCAEAVSTPEIDRVERGFLARSRQEELLCPELHLDQLMGISNVTARVQGAASTGASATDIAEAHSAERSRIEEECEADTGHSCQVVSLYHGGEYQLYEYRRYAPVKLVFIPELQAAFFGGDPDNFTYPRFALDVAFVRAYQEDGETAAETPHHFAWDPEGAEEGELVFITGNPGSTDRMATVSQLLYEQSYRHPFIVQFLEGQRSILRYIGSFGPDAERSVRDNLFSVENSLKAFTGQLGGLRDTLLLGRKIRWERELRSRIEQDADLQTEYGDTWDQIAEIQARKLELSPRLNANDPDFIGEPHVATASALVRYVREMTRPESERSEEFRGDGLSRIEAVVRGPFQADPQLAERLFALRLEVADRWLLPDDPFRSIVFRAGESPADATRRMIGESRITDVAFREGLLAGGPAAIEASADPFVRLVVEMERAHAELDAEWQEVQAAESVLEERLAGALFAAFGTDLPPDATFTLRISDGVVRRYPYNGTFAPPHTSYYGLYERATNFGGEMPWTLPVSFAERRDAVELSTPLNFVTTNDITGGNSGSPMIDREARVVGLAFDGNIEQLPNEFLFRTEAGRTIGVHSAGITEALRSIYRAEELLAELLGEGR